MAEAARTKGRILQLDIIRAFAIGLVVLVHVEGRLLAPFQTVHLAAYSLGELGVPLFVILSGFLMVHREFDHAYLGRFLARNLLPLVIVYEIWNILWWAGARWIPALSDLLIERSWLDAAKAAVFMADTRNALWFLPMMIALYLGLPLLSTAIRAFSREGMEAYRRLIAGCAIYFGTLVPTLAYLFSAFGLPQDMHSVLDLNIFGASVWGGCVWICYFVAGYWIRKGGLEGVPTWVLAVAAAGGFGGEVVLKHGLLAHDAGLHVTYNSAFVFLCAAAIFELMRRMPVARGEGARSAIGSLSAACFGIYMIHLWTAGGLFWLIGRMAPEALTGMAEPVAILACMVLVVAIMALSWAIVWLLSRIPAIGRWAFLMK